MKAAAFFSELKRRNVLRAGAFYVAAVWALAQGLAQLLPVFNAPNWITQWFVIACVIGFPFWVIFAWFYEFTPTGLKLESEIAPGESIAEHTGRRADRVIIAVLGVAVVLLMTNQFVLHRDVNSQADVADAKSLAAELAKIPKQSVAVLPLGNESGNPKQQYFSDGLSEELISELTQVDGLKVIGKYSSFKFRDSKESPAQIGAALGVANLIQGSVFQQGNRIRVTVGLISAADGASVWSHSYEEQLNDVFAIQSKIGQAVADALKIKLLGHKTLIATDKPPSGNVEVYQLMLLGRTQARRQTEAGLRDGIALFRQALKLDPNYAYAWGLLSNASVNLGFYGYVSGDALQPVYAQARVAAEKEQALAPDAAFTHSNRGYLLLVVDNDPVGALAEFRLAYAKAPNDASIINALAYQLVNLGRLQPAVELLHKAIAIDPFRPDFYANLVVALLAQGNVDAAEQATRKLMTLQPDFPLAYAALAQIDILRGDAAAAQRNAVKIADPDYKTWMLAAVAQIGPDRRRADSALREYIAKYGKDSPFDIAQLYALRKEPNQMFEWLRRAWTQHDPAFTPLVDPFVLAYQHDPRFAALCKQAGLPLPGQPLPAAAVPGGH
ncbi:MAG TPA: tetratricopeptide repeat protein [Rhodanobacter sp.]|nr:tetratricopeptide repeat protein [Rhodanobacter sp.]